MIHNEQCEKHLIIREAERATRTVIIYQYGQRQSKYKQCDTSRTCSKYKQCSTKCNTRSVCSKYKQCSIYKLCSKYKECSIYKQCSKDTRLVCTFFDFLSFLRSATANPSSPSLSTPVSFLFWTSSNSRPSCFCFASAASIFVRFA